MKHTLIIVCLWLNTCSISAQSDNTTEQSIRAILQKQETSWNKHDVNSMSNYFTDDATLINFLGMFWKSKAEISENLHKLNQEVFKHTSIKFSLKHLKVVVPGVVIANVEELFNVEEDYTDNGQQYKKGDKNYKLITNVFVRKNNEWLITASQLTLINQFVSPHQ